MINSFVVQKQNPGFHMHDCTITKAILTERDLTFEFENGIYIFQDRGVMATGFAKLIFSKLYDSGCEIQYLRDDHRECVDYDTFQDDLDIGSVTVIYEAYNEFYAHLEGILTKYPDWKTIQINIFFDKLMVYYEDGPILL